RTASRTAPLVKLGATATATPAEAARNRAVVFTMLADPAAVEAAALGPDGFLPAMARGALWVDCSTVDPAFSRRMSQEASARGIRFMDAPVAGSLPVAEKGELSFFVGGDAKDLEECRPLLSAMGKTIRNMGGTGAGTSIKLVINMLLADSMAAFSEALTLGQALGFQKSALLDTLIGGAVTAPFLAGKREKLTSGSFDAEFPLRLMLKDLGLVSTTANALGVTLPVAKAVKDLYAKAAKDGLAESDFSSIGGGP
ncbi:MAG TPA: NAD(P)-dependent oxidoreductase, partial [Spirochaetia bacterium]|nr:NAD(P)-dependent oxidoreductase [Spirochaetia bacterium]